VELRLVVQVEQGDQRLGHLVELEEERGLAAALGPSREAGQGQVDRTCQATLLAAHRLAKLARVGRRAQARVRAAARAKARVAAREGRSQPRPAAAMEKTTYPNMGDAKQTILCTWMTKGQHADLQALVSHFSAFNSRQQATRQRCSPRVPLRQR